jgi:flap endonuclease-1
MGLDLKALCVREKTNLESFASKIVAIDAYNAIYQFLSIIRGQDGLPLTDYSGKITSHVSGLFYRNINFLSLGIKPVYVFDGRPPSLKSAEIERRKQIKREATIKYENAVSEGKYEEAKKYAQQTSILKDEMVADSKKLLGLFGIPFIQAPSEGEATAAHMTITGTAYASASQDFDSLLFGAKKLVRNFTNSGRRKLPNRNTTIEVEPEIIDLNKTLADLGITREQLVDIGIFIGTDFNPEGFERIGHKTEIKAIKQYQKLEDIPQIQEKLEQVEIKQIREIFFNRNVTEVSELKFGSVDYQGITNYLTKERNFSQERVETSLNRLKKSFEKKSHNLEQWMSD